MISMSALQEQYSQGPKVRELEQQFEQYLGGHCVAVANGTMADTIALAALKELRPNATKVILPALTFIAQANAVLQADLIPVFADVDVHTNFQINPKLVEDLIDDDTLAVMPTALMGKMPSMGQLVDIAQRHDVFIVEDACEALGSMEYGALAGTLGDLGCYSFYSTHAIAAGEGGMIRCSTEQQADLCLSLRNHGRRGGGAFAAFTWDRIGYNGKMNEMEAGNALHRFSWRDRVFDSRRANLRLFNTLLGGQFVEDDGEVIIPHGYPVMVADQHAALQAITEADIECRPLFCSIPSQCMPYVERYGYCLGDFPVAEYIGTHGIYLPCHEGLSTEQIRHIAEIVAPHLMKEDVAAAAGGQR
ncbi:hypothetical protein LCGC14_0623070 [marine sediment metagenome]|uniref:DegT/DnrJ/EryC1/StrS aminotransferase family protein n=1 Tax=marine sediment metagenome TaxID=412755 RepID=A0A0F9R4B3_9ZZZZ